MVVMISMIIMISLIIMISVMLMISSWWSLLRTCTAEKGRWLQYILSLIFIQGVVRIQADNYDVVDDNDNDDDDDDVDDNDNDDDEVDAKMRRGAIVRLDALARHWETYSSNTSR